MVVYGSVALAAFTAVLLLQLKTKGLSLKEVYQEKSKEG
jgi:hypothetical protein